MRSPWCSVNARFLDGAANVDLDCRAIERGVVEADLQGLRAAATLHDEYDEPNDDDGSEEGEYDAAISLQPGSHGESFPIDRRGASELTIWRGISSTPET
jgi:hypothetical protein